MKFYTLQFRLLYALQGISTDSKLLIEIVVSHSYSQRMKIKAAYNQQAKKDLFSDIKEQLGGMFCDTMVGLVSEYTRFWHHFLNWIFDFLLSDLKLIV